jgi:hypothetical protein
VDEFPPIVRPSSIALATPKFSKPPNVIWFKYADNDPQEPGAEPSNRDANKGIVTARYLHYNDLIDEMKPLNDRAHSPAGYFDKTDPQTFGASINARRD